MNINIGITKMGFYFPQHYVSLEELLQSRGEDPNKATKGLYVKQMAILSQNEDSITMGANAIESLKCQKEKIGKLIFATECGCDSAKDNASYVHELCDLPKECEAYDIKSACAGGTYALWQVIDWILSGRGKGKLGIVVCSDKAIYKYKTGAEITGGGGAIALAIGEKPDIINFSLETGDFKNNVRDFWKPLNSEYAVVDGKLSIKSYLDALKRSYTNYIKNGGKNSFDYLIFHTPYGKLVHKGFKTLSELLPEIKDRFNTMTNPSLTASSLIGNTYNGSLYLALASLLEFEGISTRGKSVGIFAFGSGSSSKFFRGIVNPDFNNGFNLSRHLNIIKKLSTEKYEQIRRKELTIYETKGFLLKEIDEQGYRYYE